MTIAPTLSRTSCTMTRSSSVAPSKKWAWKRPPRKQEVTGSIAIGSIRPLRHNTLPWVATDRGP